MALPLKAAAGIADMMKKHNIGAMAVKPKMDQAPGEDEAAEPEHEHDPKDEEELKSLAMDVVDALKSGDDDGAASAIVKLVERSCAMWQGEEEQEPEPEPGEGEY